MVSFYELKGVLFKQAKDRLESAGPSEEYMASAIRAAHGYYYGAFAAPGWLPDFVYAEEGPYIFEDIFKAEAKARELLFHRLNANLRDGWIDGLREADLD